MNSILENKIDIKSGGEKLHQEILFASYLKHMYSSIHGDIECIYLDRWQALNDSKSESIIAYCHFIIDAYL